MISSTKRLLLALAILIGSVASTDAGAADQNTFVMGTYMFELDGKDTGRLKFVGRMGYSRFVDGKLTQSAAPTAIDLKVGFADSRQLGWVASFIAGKAEPRSAAIVTTDAQLKVKHRYELADLEIVEVLFPACEAASKKGDFIEVRTRASALARQPGSGETLTSRPEQVWQGSHFRLTIDGLDPTAVKSISAIKVRKNKSSAQSSPFEVEIAAIGASPWFSWAEQSLLAGVPMERTAKLEFLTPDFKSVLATLDLGVVTLATMDYGGDVPAGSTKIESYQFTLVPSNLKFIPAKNKGG